MINFEKSVDIDNALLMFIWNDWINGNSGFFKFISFFALYCYFDLVIL